MSDEFDSLPDAVRRELGKIILRCREDPNEFIRWACRVEGGKRVIQGPVHSEWQNFLSNNDYVILRAPVGMGKTNQVTRWRLVWELGRNPNLRIAIVSAAKGSVPTDLIDAIKQDILNNVWIKYVFPNLKPRHPPHWTSESITVQRTEDHKEPSLQIFGVGGTILGNRLDLILIDDLHNIDNTISKHACDRVVKWVRGPVLSRLPTSEGTKPRVWVVGHRWSKYDTLAELEKLPQYVSRTYSAFVKNPETGEEDSLIPDICSLAKLKNRERELGILAGPMLRNELTDLENARFRSEWFDACMVPGTKLVDGWNPAHAPVFSGVDISVGGPRGDLSVIVTAAIMPDGTRKLLDIRKGRWKAPEILRQIEDVHNAYGSIIGVENNAAQDFIIQFASALHSIPLKRHSTQGHNKWGQYGVESLATEFENKMWAIPCKAGEYGNEPTEVVREWITDFLNFSHDRGKHTADSIMATWIMRETARQAGYSADGLGTDEDLASFLDADTLTR